MDKAIRMAGYDKYVMSLANKETLRINTVPIIKYLDLSDPICTGYLKQHDILTDHSLATLKVITLFSETNSVNDNC